MPPAPTPATRPVTASGAIADTGIPTSSDSPIAFRTAAGHAGAAERKARTMKTNGMQGQAEGDGGPAGGRASASSEATATSAATIPQYAGTRSRVASMIARHFRAGTAGRSRPGGSSSPDHGVQPLTAPAVSPRTKYFCSEKNTTSGNAIEMNAAAVSRCQFSPRAPTRFGEGDREHPVLPGPAEEHVGDEQVVPDPEELEDRERRERRHRERDDQPPEDREVVGSVDLRRLDDRRRQRADVVPEQIDGQGQPEGGVGQPHAEEGAVQIEVGEDLDAEQRGAVDVQAQDRDQRHLQRHDQQPDHGDEHHVAAPEVHPRERVRSERGDRDRDHRRGDRDREAIQERVPRSPPRRARADSSRSSTRRPGTDARTTVHHPVVSTSPPAGTR